MGIPDFSKDMYSLPHQSSTSTASQLPDPAVLAPVERPRKHVLRQHPDAAIRYKERIESGSMDFGGPNLNSHTAFVLVHGLEGWCCGMCFLLFFIVVFWGSMVG